MIYKVWFRRLPSYLLLSWPTSGVKFKREKTAGKTRAGETRWSLSSVGSTLFVGLRHDDDERVRHEYLQKQWFLHALRGLHVLYAFHAPRVRLFFVFFFWCICLTSSVKRREMNKFQVLWRTSAHNAKRSLFKSKLLTRSCHFHALTLY